MATIRYDVCDRCGGKIKQQSKKLVRVPTHRVQKFLWFVTGVTIVGHKDLCAVCTEKLERFLENKVD